MARKRSLYAVPLEHLKLVHNRSRLQRKEGVRNLEGGGWGEASYGSVTVEYKGHGGRLALVDDYQRASGRKRGEVRTPVGPVQCAIVGHRNARKDGREQNCPKSSSHGVASIDAFACGSSEGLGITEITAEQAPRAWQVASFRAWCRRSPTQEGWFLRTVFHQRQAGPAQWRCASRRSGVGEDTAE